MGPTGDSAGVLADVTIHEVATGRRFVCQQAERTDSSVDQAVSAGVDLSLDQQWDVAGASLMPWVKDVAWSPDGVRLIGVSQDARLYVWARNGALRQDIPGDGLPIEAVAWSPDGASGRLGRP